MLSYAEHGKFRMATQGRHPRARRKRRRLAPIRHGFFVTFRPLSGSWDVHERKRGGAPALTIRFGLRHSCDPERFMRQRQQK
jgi:hypothetical protein